MKSTLTAAGHCVMPLLALTLCLNASPLAASQYTVIDLGSYGGPSYPIALNNERQIPGRSYITNFVGNITQRGFVWDIRHGTREFQSLVGLEADLPACLDNTGRIGFNASSRGYLWHPVSGLTDLNAGATNGQPLKTIRRISDAGHIVGRVNGGYFLQHGDTVHTFTGFRLVTAVNSHGLVGGRSDDLGGFPVSGQARLWDATNGIRNLGVLPGKAMATVEGLNSHGHAVGWSAEVVNAVFGAAPAVAMAFLWTADNLTPLPPPSSVRDPSFTNTQAHAINDAGQIVGRAHNITVSVTTPYLPDGDAVLWTSGVAVNLNSLLPPDSGWVLQSASGINDHGDIVGYGLHHGETRAYLLTPNTWTPPLRIAREGDEIVVRWIEGSTRMTLEFSAGLGAAVWMRTTHSAAQTPGELIEHRHGLQPEARFFRLTTEP